MTREDIEKQLESLLSKPLTLGSERKVISLLEKLTQYNRKQYDHAYRNCSARTMRPLAAEELGLLTR
jgi:hypothetical protein